jgi:hypothetical protein
MASPTPEKDKAVAERLRQEINTPSRTGINSLVSEEINFLRISRALTYLTDAEVIKLNDIMHAEEQEEKTEQPAETEAKTEKGVKVNPFGKTKKKLQFTKTKMDKKEKREIMKKLDNLKESERNNMLKRFEKYALELRKKAMAARPARVLERSKQALATAQAVYETSSPPLGSQFQQSYSSTATRNALGQEVSPTQAAYNQALAGAAAQSQQDSLSRIDPLSRSDAPQRVQASPAPAQPFAQGDTAPQQTIVPRELGIIVENPGEQPAQLASQPIKIQGAPIAGAQDQQTEPNLGEQPDIEAALSQPPKPNQQKEDAPGIVTRLKQGGNKLLAAAVSAGVQVAKDVGERNLSPSGGVQTPRTGLRHRPAKTPSPVVKDDVTQNLARQFGQQMPQGRAGGVGGMMKTALKAAAYITGATTVGTALYLHNKPRVPRTGNKFYDSTKDFNPDNSPTPSGESPTGAPTAEPTSTPTAEPTSTPTQAPSSQAPTQAPTDNDGGGGVPISDGLDPNGDGVANPQVQQQGNRHSGQGGAEEQLNATKAGAAIAKAISDRLGVAMSQPFGQSQMQDHSTARVAAQRRKRVDKDGRELYDDVMEGRVGSTFTYPTLRPEYVISGKDEAVMSAYEQLRGDVEFDLFSVVKPGFGLGSTNTIYLDNEKKTQKVQYKDPLYVPRQWDGFEHGVVPPPVQFAPVMTRAQMVRGPRKLMKRMRDEENYYAAFPPAASNQVLPGDNMMVGSSTGLKTNNPSPLLPHIDTHYYWQKAQDPAGFKMQTRKFRKLYDPLRKPQSNSVLQSGLTSHTETYRRHPITYDIY